MWGGPGRGGEGMGSDEVIGRGRHFFCGFLQNFELPAN